MERPPYLENGVKYQELKSVRLPRECFGWQDGGIAMGMFLNSRVPFEEYKNISRIRFFVDKSSLIDEIITAMIMDGQQYLCITRPRRFGKSVMAHMIGAFFGKAAKAEQVFDNLEIAQSPYYHQHLNQYDVIFIDFSKMPRDCRHYSQYIQRIQNGINRDLINAYPELELGMDWAVWDNLQMVFERTGCRFIFVMDEWDAIFHSNFITESDKKHYLGFLRDMLKGQAYVEFAYMTGVLPIAKYSSGSEINMFREYDMAAAEMYSEYFGFLQSEVDSLFEIYLRTSKYPKISKEDLKLWYDGYHTASGKQLYNPRSIVCALTDNQLRNYWTNSGPYDEIFYYVKNNVQDIRDDLAFMISGEKIDARIQEYAATAAELRTKDQIYSAMVVYGLLTYDSSSGKVFIPNKELMDKFNELLLSKDSLGYIHSLAKESEKMLKATLAGDTQTMVRILKFAHDTESPILSYNSETELSAVVNLVYLSARDKYRIEREDKAGEGYVDFIFYPEHKNAESIILELKIDSSPEEAIRQIKQKKYALRFRGRLGEKPRYTGKVLAVGISYHKKTKEHFCQIEQL